MVLVPKAVGAGGRKFLWFPSVWERKKKERRVRQIYRERDAAIKLSPLLRRGQGVH